MNRDKQIEEMCKKVCYCYNNTLCEITLKPCEFDCGEAKALGKLYDAGYRKASEVALEVIGEINDNFDQMVNEAENTIMDAIQEGNLTAARIARYGKDVIILARNTLTKMLEKKYTEGEKDNDTY